MATKNIVPNSDGEGKLGTSSKSWAEGHIDSITGTIATAAQGSITSLGTLTTLTVDNVIVNGTTIGHTSDTDLLTLASASLTVAGNITLNVASDSNPRITFDGAAVDDGHFIQVNRSTEAMEFHASDVTVLTLDTSSVSTFAGNLKIPDSGTIGCASDTDLLTLTANNLLINGSTVNNKINTLFTSQNSSTAAHTSGFKFCNDENGGIYYDSSADDLSIFANQASSNIFLRTAGTIALTLDSSQNATFAGDLAVSGGDITLGNGAATTISPTDTGSGVHGSNLTISAGAAAGGADTNGGDLTLSSGGAGGTGSGGTSTMIFKTAIAADAQGVVSERMKFDTAGDLTLNNNLFINSSKAIYIGGTSSPNAFDDYEEGSWTPRVTDGTDVAQSNGTYTRGDYTKIGRLVHCSFQIVLTDLTSSGGGEVNGSIRMDGFPFANRNVQGAQSGGVIGAATSLNITAGHSVVLVMRINVAEADFSLTDSTGGTTDMQASEFTDDGQVKGSISYMTDL